MLQSSTDSIALICGEVTSLKATTKGKYHKSKIHVIYPKPMERWDPGAQRIPMKPGTDQNHLAQISLVYNTVLSICVLLNARLKQKARNICVGIFLHSHKDEKFKAGPLSAEASCIWVRSSLDVRYLCWAFAEARDNELGCKTQLSKAIVRSKNKIQ